MEVYKSKFNAIMDDIERPEKKKKFKEEKNSENKNIVIENKKVGMKLNKNIVIDTKKVCMKLKGKMSKGFFDYLDDNSLDVNDIDSSMMSKISLETGLKYGYVKKLRSRYGNKIIVSKAGKRGDLKGKLSKLFFDYLESHNISIDNLDCYIMSDISKHTGLKYSYVKMLKSRYGDKERFRWLDEHIIYGIRWFDKYSDDYTAEFYDTYSIIKKVHKEVIIKFLEREFKEKLSLSLFDKMRNNDSFGNRENLKNLKNATHPELL